MSKKQHWQSVYQTKEIDDVSWYQREPATSLSMLEGASLSQDSQIIDIGAGASVLADCLLEKGFQSLSLLDVSAAALAQTKKRLKNKANRIEWLVSDVREFSTERQFDCWHDRAAFHFLVNENDRADYKKRLHQYLKPNGHLIIATFAIGGPSQCSGLPIVQYDEAKMKNEMGTKFKLLESLNEVHMTPWKTEQKFTYFHFQKQFA